LVQVLLLQRNNFYFVGRQIAFACAFVAAPTALAGFICRDVILDPALAPTMERLRAILFGGVYFALLLLGGALWQIMSHALLPLVGQIGVMAGLLWLLAVFMLAFHTLDRHRSAT